MVIVQRRSFTICNAIIAVNMPFIYGHHIMVHTMFSKQLFTEHCSATLAEPKLLVQSVNIRAAHLISR